MSDTLDAILDEVRARFAALEDRTGAPQVKETGPLAGAPGETVTLTGERLDTIARVRVDGNPVWARIDPEKIEFQVPDLAAGTYPVQLVEAKGEHVAVGYLRLNVAAD
ncbi:IPT/TIG domain-containing protein (plasmid) [Streptomyces sp. BI20]|uniref:IPT/TIG domain-containing protein n=1 Tax=Streptomyces sp. BI20 TaxID=3403460 RepID=UPI003C77B565